MVINVQAVIHQLERDRRKTEEAEEFDLLQIHEGHQNGPAENYHYNLGYRMGIDRAIGLLYGED